MRLAVGVVLAGLLSFASSYVLLQQSRLLARCMRSSYGLFKPSLSPDHSNLKILKPSVLLALKNDNFAADPENNQNGEDLLSNKHVNSETGIPEKDISEKDMDDELSASEGSNVKADDEISIVHQKLESLKHHYRSQISQFRNREIRHQICKQIQTGFSSVFKHFALSMRDGEVGAMGGGWLVAQIFLVGSIFLGIPPLVQWMLALSGILSTIAGFYFLLHALLDLGELTTSFVNPTKTSVVVDNGVYRLVRHPMYGGLLMICAGVSIILGSVNKLLLTLVLAWVLNAAADIEEEQLLRRHGELYVSYMSGKKKFIPLLL
jgi:protein-S-isoprenylcysteine O-methyltransferase Ste14